MYTFKCIIFPLALIINITASYANTIVCTREKDCPEPSRWSVGLALGAGARTNPLETGDPIPLIVRADIAYYGDHVYFDNGELGARWRLSNSKENNLHQFSLFLVPNREQANFTFSNPLNFVTSIVNSGIGTDSGIGTNSDDDVNSEDTPPEVTINTIESRRWAFDSGIRWRWQLGNTIVSSAVFSDISDVYNGLHASVSATSRWKFSQWTLQASPRVFWLSDELTNYYYGVREENLVASGQGFDARGGFQFGLQTMAARPIADTKWQVLFQAGVLRLHDGMVESPLVDKRILANGFIGMAYQF